MIKETPSEFVSQGDVTISCKFVGYYPEGGHTVQWDFEGHALGHDSGKYTISHDPGKGGQSQNGKSFVGPSFISSLTIFSLKESDKGIYGCRIIGDSCLQLIGYIQIGDVGEHTHIHVHTLALHVSSRNLVSQVWPASNTESEGQLSVR